MSKTAQQYTKALEECKRIFLNKMKDYGTSWRVLRTSSLTDQIYIKAQRIRTIQEKGVQKVDEGIRPEFIGIINYCIMALIQLELKNDSRIELPYNEVEALYSKHAKAAFDLMEAKNHDYGEAWRSMRISTFADMMLMRIQRIKQIEDNQGVAQFSEGLDANYMDMINYGMFALIQLSEQTENI